MLCFCALSGTASQPYMQLRLRQCQRRGLRVLCVVARNAKLHLQALYVCTTSSACNCLVIINDLAFDQSFDLGATAVLRKSLRKPGPKPAQVGPALPRCGWYRHSVAAFMPHINPGAETRAASTTRVVLPHCAPASTPTRVPTPRHLPSCMPASLRPSHAALVQL